MNGHTLETSSKSTRTTLLAFFLQLLLGGCAISVCVWEGMPWPATAGLALAAGFASSVSRKGVSSKSDLFAWWCSSLGFLASLLMERDRFWFASLLPEGFFSLLGAIAMVASLCLSDSASKANWRVTGIVWAFPGVVLWVAISYSQNLGAAFFFSLILCIALLCLCKAWFHPSPIIIQGWNTLLLISAGLLLLGLTQRTPKAADASQFENKSIYQYAQARKDPAGYRRWWGRYGRQWAQVLRTLFDMHPGSPLFYRARPGCEATFFQSRVVLNHLGFRGKEIADPKGNTYRIVALGESTTFGSTINAEDKPWPEQLEQMIRERLKPLRPVEVVNAGTPSFGLTNNLLRLSREILPLQPDMLISYHGFNGFNLLQAAPLRQQVPVPPVYHDRPVRLLADFEYNLRLKSYRHRRAAQGFDLPDPSAAIQTEYARAYQDLIGIASTNSICLVLATYSMAVNRQSDPAVISFFGAGFPETPASITANEVHSLLLRRLSEENPAVTFVDTHPGLDGEHDLFLDLMHLTQAGDRRLAETIFQSIKGVLEQDLVKSQ